MLFNWSDIDTVLLDMDGTLLDLSYDNYFWHHHLPKTYANLHKLKLDATRKLLLEKSDSLKGSLDWYCLDHWSSSLNLDLEKLKAEIQHMVRFRPYAINFLSFLKARDKEVILVTNAHPKTLQVKANAVHLQQYLDKMVSSHDLGLAKENAGFWPLFSKTENVDLSRSLFIDDSPAVLHCAQTEGVKYLVQVLQPDTGLPPVTHSNFLNIIDLNELMDEAS